MTTLDAMMYSGDIQHYATAADTITNYFKDMPEEFSNQFGFDLYKNNNSEQKVKNSELLYADMYINTNDDLFIKN